jgi:hypothetical protein
MIIPTQTVNFAIVELEKFSLDLTAASLAVIFLIWLIGGTQMRRVKRRLRENYRLIYRVTSIPSDGQCILKADGTSIAVGDYGWEAEPIYQDGLIYLHGLNSRWQVVWYCGFRPDQLEVVGPKPRSQYYIFPDWVDFKKVPQCPYTVKEYQLGMYPTFHLGFAVKMERDWIQGRKLLKHI